MSRFAMVPVLAALWGVATTNVYAQVTQPLETWVRINAFTDAPLAQADVEIYDTAGRRIFMQANATNSRGVFAAKVPDLPRNFRVLVTGEVAPEHQLGRLRLSSDVRHFKPEHDIVYVNLVTTIVSRLIDRYPGSTLPQEQALVRRFLGLPANASLGAALRHGNRHNPRHFSHTAFHAEAAKHGGVEAFLNTLVTEMNINLGSKRPFSPAPQPVSDTLQLTSPVPVPPSLLSAAATFVGEKLAAGALSWAAGQGMGWAAHSAGLLSPGATKADIQVLQDGLADLQSSVDELSKQISALSEQMNAMLTELQYSVVATPANAMAGPINGLAGDLAFLAEICPPLAETDTPSEPSEFCKNQKATLVSQLNAHLYDYETLLKYVLDDTSQRKSGMIHLFSQALGQSVRFFRPADSTTVQNYSDYWNAVLTQAATLKVELLHQNGAQNDPKSAVLLTNFLGDVNVNPPTKGTLQTMQDQQAQLVFPMVPIGTVIHTTDRTMWAIESPITSYPGCLFWPGNAWGVSNKPQLANINMWGLAGWHSPHLDELQKVISEGGSSPLNWLINQTEAVAPEYPESPGFANLIGIPNVCGDSGSRVWTQTLTGSYFSVGGQSKPIYYTIRMDNGTLSSTTADTGIEGNYNWLYLIRELARGEDYYWHN